MACCFGSYADGGRILEVSFFELMSTPEKYRDRTVGVSGVIDANAESNRGYLFLSKEHYEYGVSENAIKVIYPDNFKCGNYCGEYFHILGTVRVDVKGNLKYIDDIKTIVWDGLYIWPPEVEDLGAAASSN